MFEFPVAFVILYDHLRKKGEGKILQDDHRKRHTVLCKKKIFFAILYVYVAKDSSYNGAVLNFGYSSSEGGGGGVFLSN